MHTPRLDSLRVSRFAPILLLLFVAVSASANTYYVPDDYATVTIAINAAQDKDTILVHPGDYETFAVFNGKKLTVRSTNGPLVTTLRPANQLLPVFSMINTEPIDTEIAGFTFTGYDSMLTAEPRSIILVDNFARPRIKDCIFRDNKMVRVLSCVAAAVEIRRNLFYNNTGDFCISLWKGLAAIMNNTIVNCDNGILTMAADIEVNSNIVAQCRFYGIKGSIYGLDFNDVWGNGLNYGDGAIPGLHDMSADPLFVAPASNDFHIQETSPCRDAGNPSAFFNDPDGSRNDMGAYPVTTTTDVDNAVTDLPATAKLEQNYPNPFNSETQVSFSLPTATNVVLDVFNIRGQLVRRLVDERYSAGSHRVTWDGRDREGKSVSSGIYFYRLTSAKRSETRRMIVLK